MKYLTPSLIALSLVPFGAIAQEQSGATLTVAIPGNINTLDPARTKVGEEYILNNLMFANLTRIAADGEIEPDLATNWESNDDLTEWTFQLREDVTFHDGSSFEAEDVKATVERLQDPETASVARVMFEMVDSIEVVDPHTITFRLSQPYAGFPDIFGARQAGIVPSELDDTLASEPVGAGPFEFVSFQPGDSIEVSRFDDYYADGQPKLGGVTLTIIPERSSQVAALESDQVDILWDLTPEMVQQLEGSDEVKVDSVPTSAWDGVIMNAAQAPFDDPKVRKAVSLALDKSQLEEIALFGTGTPTHTMIPPDHAFYNEDLEISPADPEAARGLLAEAGFEDGFEITLYVPGSRPTRERLGVAAAEMLGEVGIDVSIQRVPWDRFISEIEGQAAFFTDGFYGRPTLDTSIYPWYHSGGSWNSQLWNYSNSEMDEVLDNARVAEDEEARAASYKEFQRLAVEEPAGVIPYVLNHANAFTPELGNFSSHPMMWLDLRNATLE